MTILTYHIHYVSPNEKRSKSYGLRVNVMVNSYHL